MSFAKLYKFLFTDEKYKTLSSDAKLLYTLIADRFSLSRKNGWQDRNGRCFVIFTRQEAAQTLGISERTAIKCFNELEKSDLIQSKNQGKTKPMLLYPKKLPFIPEKIADSDLQNFHPNNTDINKTEINKTDIQSVCDGRTDFPTLSQIKERCELEIWPDGTRELIEGIIEKIYYADSLKVGGRTLSKQYLMQTLKRLTADSIIYAVDSFKAADTKIKNPSAYLMSAIINSPDDYEASEMF